MNSMNFLRLSGKFIMNSLIPDNIFFPSWQFSINRFNYRIIIKRNLKAFFPVNFI